MKAIPGKHYLPKSKWKMQMENTQKEHTDEDI